MSEAETITSLSWYLPLNHLNEWVRGVAPLTLRWIIACQAVLLVIAGVAVAVMLERTQSYSVVLEENLGLRERVESVDRKVNELDQLLLRLRVYEAQLDGLVPADGAGPISGIPGEADPDEPARALPELLVGDGLIWADGVLQRADARIEGMADSEPNLNAMVTQLEDLRALRAALPARWPCRGSLTSQFGVRKNPTARGAQFHHGIDIASRRGTPIMAVAAGRVRTATYNGGYGRYVEIDHGYGITTRYAHMNRLLVRAGDYVEEGTLVGTMGRTGRVTGTHLHFEVRVDGRTVDPLEFLPGR